MLTVFLESVHCAGQELQSRLWRDLSLLLMSLCDVLLSSHLSVTWKATESIIPVVCS